LIFVWPCKWFARSLQGEPGRTFSGCDRQSNPPLGHTELQACRENERGTSEGYAATGWFLQVMKKVGEPANKGCVRMEF